ncbi:[Fe-Fe] hydrogenase large subunit C-terminal domain-containing protein [Clostridiisalibacter paucivorans]|uniref:[Fe-Fe] hydrogenase large subunit C-terminal domain-containing protein n=1 Tax=Clostridiisalibacter paucivorans TaxID=408753 RepID=UPI000479B380|nr:[Fe-Fe] hydrogenase large subunit C-terminal domain-containing protein [Clostridiisalibacter paucivorans]
MADKFYNFQDKRMKIFGELVRRYWDGNLKDNTDLNQLANEIRDKYGFEDADMSFIKNHIRIAMGLNPNEDEEFTDEIQMINGMSRVNEPIVNKLDEPCEYCDNSEQCEDICKYDAHIYRRGKGPVIVNDKCLNCGRCVSQCSFGAIADKIEFLPMVNYLKDKDTKVYATVAPSIVGQFGDKVSMGKIRTALRMMGFEDMIEVALFADILTIKEALEFHHLVKDKDDFFLTSCCCPVWISLTEKHYPKLFEHMSPSVSPMVASGRILKEFYPDAKVVFIGPCIAKKGEAKNDMFKDDIDFVLTFKELEEIFDALDIDFENIPADEKDQASYGGRVYARTGGVSFSVKTVVNRIAPRRLVKFKSKRVDGVMDCKNILDYISQNDNIDFNFIEGMGCEGGCVGGPKTNINVEKATTMVNEFGEDSLIMTPFDNGNIMKVFKELGVKHVDELINDSKISRLLAREKLNK